MFAGSCEEEPHVKRQRPRSKDRREARPVKLSKQALLDIIGRIQAILWLDDDDGDGEYWNKDKEWDNETLDFVAQVLVEHGLSPHKARSSKRAKPKAPPQLPKSYLELAELADKQFIDEAEAVLVARGFRPHKPKT